MAIDKYLNDYFLPVLTSTPNLVLSSQVSLYFLANGIFMTRYQTIGSKQFPSSYRRPKERRDKVIRCRKANSMYKRIYNVFLKEKRVTSV